MKALLLAAALAAVSSAAHAETVYRAMLAGLDGRPVAADAPDSLGVRYGQMSENDIATSGGMVSPSYMNRPQGMGVARGNPCDISVRRRPAGSWGGKVDKAELAVWSLDTARLPAPLRFTIEDGRSGLIAPALKMPVADYTKALAGTAPLWAKVEAPSKPCP